jgi:hypothetical protein
MFSTAPTAPAAAQQASGPAPAIVANAAGSSSRWSTGGDADAGSDRGPRRTDDNIVDASVIDDDEHVVDLGSLHGDDRSESPSAPSGPPSHSGGPPPEPTPRSTPENSRSYRSMPEASNWDNTTPYRRTEAPFLGGETFGAQPSHEAVHVADPQGVSAAISRLTPSSQQNGAAAFMVAAALLGPDERVLVAVQGWSHGMPAVAVLTTMRAIVVFERQWKPVVESFPLRPSLAVFGRHLDGRAAMTFQDGDKALTIEQIADVGLAVELAEATRAQSTRNAF